MAFFNPVAPRAEVVAFAGRPNPPACWVLASRGVKPDEGPSRPEGLLPFLALSLRLWSSSNPCLSRPKWGKDIISGEEAVAAAANSVELVGSAMVTGSHLGR